jgi:enoyl-CoA hydratase/carnithine racemase
MWLALARLMPALAADDAVDVVVLRGTPGGPFSAGADIAEFQTLRADAAGARRYGEAVEAGEQALIAFPKPTVALVEGFAIGGGTQLAAACDLRVCETGSRFGVTPAKLGIVYALGSTARLVEVGGSAWSTRSSSPVRCPRGRTPSRRRWRPGPGSRWRAARSSSPAPPPDGSRWTTP